MTDVFTRHKPIRNKIKTYDPISVIGMGIDILHSKIDTARNPTEWNNYLPWHILILLRWVYQYSEPGCNLKVITQNEFNALYNSIYDLNDRVVLEGQARERVLDTALRRMMFYQLPFQVRNYEIFSSFGRQLVMFKDMGDQYGLDTTFQGITGLNLTDYFDLYLCSWEACDGGDALKLSVAYFRNQFSEDTIRAFFATTALTLDQAKGYIHNHTAAKEIRKWIDYQLNEHTPLERYPFFANNDRFIPYSRKLMDNSFMYNAYDIFKENNPNFSRDTFGKIFEDYVGKGVRYACPNFLRENQIRKSLPANSKTADFLIQENQATILIDAKSTELHPIARVMQDKASIIRNLEDTIIHGVIQIIVTAHHLRKAGVIDGTNAIYGIVVTFKDYLIGDGKKFWEEIIKDHVEQKLTQLNIANTIQPEHLFFLSIEEFDYLMAGVKERNLSVSEVLASAAENNNSPQTSTLMLKQHLDKIWGQYYRPEYVRQRCDQCFDSIKQRFS